MSASGVFHGGGIDAAAVRYGRPVDEWLDLSTGINPCPPALPQIDASFWHRLPDRGQIEALQTAAASFYGSGAVRPLPASGTQILIRALADQADRGRRVAILSPTYGEYQHVFEGAGFGVDPISSLDQVSPAHGLVVVVNPNNPDGRIVARDELVQFTAQLRSSETTLVVDEAFGDLMPELSMAAEVERFSNLVVLRSFGKFFGYAGLRLAFAIAGMQHAASIERFIGPWPVSGPALAIGTALLCDDHQGIRKIIRERRAALDVILTDRRLPVVGGTDLFALVAVDNARVLFERLAGEGILTRAFDYRPDWLRIGLFATDEDGSRLSAALKSCL